MKYSFSCPTTCNFEIRVDAKNEDEAVAKIAAEGAIHGRQFHPHVSSMTEEQLRKAAHGVLPGLFAWPAGAGDIAIGITAPWVALALVRRSTFAASPQFVAWNLFGILDLIVAVSTGTLSSGFIAGLAGNITTAPMAQLPLVLIPAFFVPLFIMFHIAALLQARRNLLPERSRWASQ